MFIPQISFIGEETLEAGSAIKDMSSFAWFEDILATEQSLEYQTLVVDFRAACGSSKVDQQLLRVDNNNNKNKETNNNNNNHHKPPTVQIYVDPIDGTNAMVAGKKRVPMTLIGICLSGVPVAGVVNRIFAGDPHYILNEHFNKNEEKSSSCPKSPVKKPADNDVCPPTLSLCIEGGPCWMDGKRITSVPPLEENQKELVPSFIEAKTLRVLAGSNGRARHDVIFRYLEPSRWFETRGAGNKLMALANGATLLESKLQSEKALLRQQEGNSSHFYGTSGVPRPTRIDSDKIPDDLIFDVFVSKGQIAKWDTAAPHAFLRWLNSDIFRII